MFLRTLLAVALAGSIVSAQIGPDYPARSLAVPIDHFPDNPRYAPHTNDTFQQRFFFDSKFYKPGGPVFLYIGGETSGPSRFENLRTGIIHVFMKHTNGLGVILENRYYGHSHPYNDSTTDHLAYLTNEQTIADIAYFAQHAKFAGIDADLTAPKTPWILYGGSLAGAETAFAVKRYNNLLWGGIASSAVVHAVHSYPNWYANIQKYAPQDCMHSINKIVDKIDELIACNNTKAITELKTIFGLESITDMRDFTNAIAFPIGNPFYYPSNTWQELNWFPRYGSPDFFNFCDAVSAVNPPADVKAIDQQLAKYTDGETWTNLGNYASYIKSWLLPLCKSGDYNSPECFGTQHPQWWARTQNTGERSYLYTTCTEIGAYQAAPKKGPSLISRVIQIDYTQQWCDWAFPPGKYNSIDPKGPHLEYFNEFGGFDVRANRLAFIDGSIDPWLDVTYHSTEAPTRYYSDLHPELLIAGAGHHWDSYGILNLSAEPQFIMQAQLFEVRVVKRWLQEFEECNS